MTSAGMEAGSPLADEPRRGRLTAKGLGSATRDTLYLVLGAAALVWAYIWIRAAIRDGALGFDFEGTLWNPGSAILDGRSPYPAPLLREVDVGNPALYPPLLMMLLSPLTLLPWGLGLAIWTGVLIASVAATLYLLGVRDLRCYALAFVSAPVLNGLIWGNATLLLVPMVALAWHWRDRWARAGVVVGLAIASKLFLWPLFFWLLGTRRYRAAAAAGATAVAAFLIPWAAIGFDGLGAYPDLLRVAERVFGLHGYSIATMASALGAPEAAALRLPLVAAIALGAVAFASGRRGRDAAALSLAVLAAVLGSSIVWEYYYALLLVPLAIARPRFSGLWMILPLFYFTHRLPRPHLSSADIEPGGLACCQPDGVPLSSWVFNHAPAGLWPALGHALLAVLITAAIMWGSHDSARRSEACR
jgi:hypothetical protein